MKMDLASNKLQRLICQIPNNINNFKTDLFDP